MSVLSDNKTDVNIHTTTNTQEQSALKNYIERTVPREKTLIKLQTKNPFEVDSTTRVQTRKALINPNDLYTLERVIGNNDIFPIHYLEKGLLVAKSICRIIIHDKNRRVLGFGTGFMVSPTLLITNNHVLPNTDVSIYSTAQFSYEEDLNYKERKSQIFSLEPDTFFITNVELDFTLIAVKEKSNTGNSISEYGHLLLINQTGKALLGEYVSIIQHPEGGYKSIVIRENEIIDMFGDLIHYTADTNPGSSGSAVFNDNWEVVALHHSSIPDPNQPGKYVANEGIRISSILQYIERNRSSLNIEQQKLIKDFGIDINVTQIHSEDDIINISNIDEDNIAEDFSLERYDNLIGHDVKFIGEHYNIPFPKLRADLENDVVETIKGEKILNYTHFSIVMSKSRRLSFYTVVDIDGNQLKQEQRVRWRYDSRIDRKYQCGNELYINNKFDRGHLVRRKDPIWGHDSFKANEDTFHFTNCAPQHERVNQSNEIWQGLENYLLDNISDNLHKAVVFTGPVFRQNDMVYRGVKIPEEFWKVAVVKKDSGELSTTAYIVSQKEFLNDFETTVPGAFKTFQVKVSIIEALTGLDFHDLRNYDPLERIESATYGKLIKHFEDILL